MTDLPSVSQAKLPASYVEAKRALNACAKDFSPERYVVASAALSACLERDECEASNEMEALGSYAKQANDSSLMRLAAIVDQQRKEWAKKQKQTHLASVDINRHD